MPHSACDCTRGGETHLCPVRREASPSSLTTRPSVTACAAALIEPRAGGPILHSDTRGRGGGGARRQKQLIGHKPEEGSSLRLKLSLHITSCVLMLPSDRWPAMCQTAPESADGGKNVAFSSAATSAPFVTWERRPTETRWGVVSLFEDPICRRGGRKDVFPFPRSPLCTSMATTGSTSIQEIWCRKGRPYFEYSSDSSTATKTGSSTL